MESRQAMKRRRSEDEDPTGRTQTKVFVNQKMAEKNDSSKMKKVHDKTTKMLFDGMKKPLNHPLASPYELWKQYYIAGDGTVKVLEILDAEDTNSFQRKASQCCRRPSLVHADCANCTTQLCEYCGYSCLECGQFVCKTCVTLFGNTSDDHPLCEVCQMYLT